MKVPKMYKSSDRYNAGTDVIYNDDSKLQYAPFIYATTESGDGGGDDEEGEDVMIINITSDEQTGYATADKTFTEITGLISSGKNVMFKWGDIYSTLLVIDANELLIYVDAYNTAKLTRNVDGYPAIAIGD